jgi:hypothetical protein
MQPLADHHYTTLSAQERFALLLEAMARRDEVEADRLEETCPRFTYRAEDQAFRDRMRRAYMIASRVCLNIQSGLAQLRLARAFHNDAARFADPVVRLAQITLLYGRAYGHWEAGCIDAIALPDPAGLDKEIEADADLQTQLVSVTEVAEDAVKQVAGRLMELVLDGYAVDLLSRWEGFGRFCHHLLGVGPMTIAMSFRLLQGDPTAEIRSARPSVKADELRAQEWEREFSKGWERLFKT